MNFDPLGPQTCDDRWIGIRRPNWKRRELKIGHVHDLLYVASDLTTVVIPAAFEIYHRRRLDLVQDGVAYRYLNATWYGWLHHRVQQAIRLAEQGHLSSAARDQVLDAWAPIVGWAREHLPMRSLVMAEQSYPSTSYAPPRAA